MAYFLRFRDQAALREEYFRRINSKREAQMEGFKLAYAQATGQLHQFIVSLEK